MKIHAIIFEPFQSSRLLIRPSHDAYAELGQAYLSSMEAQQATKRRSRQIAASAVKYLRESMEEPPAIMEPEVIRVLNLVSDAMALGIDHPAPFSQEAHIELKKLIGGEPRMGQAWRRVVAGLIQAAEREMTFEEFIVFDVFAAKLAEAFRFGQAACAIRSQVDAMAEEAAARFLGYCAGEPGVSWTMEEREATKELIREFYAGLTEVLEMSLSLEVRLFLVRFTAERFAVRYECSLQEWQFLFSVLENCVEGRAGLEVAGHLRELFQGMLECATGIGFAGAAHRKYPEIQPLLEEVGMPPTVDSKLLLQAAVGEMLMGAGGWTEPTPPIRVWAIVHGQSVFSSVSPSDFRKARKVLAESLLLVAERSWVDRVDEPLEQMEAAVEWVALRRKAGEWMDGVAERAVKNLTEGLEVLRSNSRLTGDVIALMDHACLADIYFRNPEQKTTYLRRWFLVNIVLGQMENGWQHGKTIASSLRTVFGAVGPGGSLHERVAQGLEHLEKLGGWLEEGERVLGAWPHLTAHGLAIETYIPEATCQRDALWLLRRLVLAWLHVGIHRAPRVTLRWLAREVVPFAKHPNVEDFERTYLKAVEMVEAHEVLRTCGVVPILRKVAEGTTSAVLSERLWMDSVEVAKRAADQVYAELPEYAREAETRKGAFGETSKALCVRDQSLILRRIAKALDPEVSDPEEFVGLWWNNVVNAYIRTRSSGLFATQLRALRRAGEEVVGPKAGAAVERILKPILPGADEAEGGSLPDRLVFRDAMSRAPVREGLVGAESSALAGWAREEQGKLAGWMALHRSEAKRYALDFPVTGQGFEVPAAVGEAFEGILSRQWPAFILHGGLDDEGCEEMGRWAGGDVQLSQWAERCLMGWMTEAASRLEEGDIARVIYFGHWVEWLRQMRAGVQIMKSASDWASATVEHLHGIIPGELSAAGHAVDAEKCRRDFSRLMVVLGKLLQEKTADSARIHLQRYLIQMVVPYTNYNELVWSMVWGSVELKRGPMGDMEAEASLTSWFSELETCGRWLSVVGPIARRVNGGDEPVFSADAKEEAAWRDSINLMLSLASLGSQPEGEISPRLARAAILSLPLNRGVFERQLSAVISAVRDWFLELDLTPIRRAAEAMKQAIEREQVQAKGWGQVGVLGPKLSQMLKCSDGAGVALLGGAMREVTGLVGGPEPMGLSTVFLWTDQLRSSCPMGTRVDAARLKTALANLLADIPEVWSRAESRVSEVAGGWDKSEALREMWRMTNEFNLASEHGVSCARDQHWLARRVAVAVCVGEPSAAGVLRWFGGEVLRQAGYLETETVLRMVRHLRGQFEQLMEGKPDRLKLLDELISGVPGLMVGRRLYIQGEEVADRVVERAGLGREIDQSKCRRDVGLVLKATGWDMSLGRGQDGNYFGRAVTPFLQEPTREMAGKVFRSLVEMSREEWSVEESKAVEGTFQEWVRS